jgi:hypothetical protein
MDTMTKILLAFAFGAIALVGWSSAGEAQSTERSARLATTSDSVRPKARSHRKGGPRVYGYYRGYRGGYSYTYNDVANTYGLSRSLYGSTNTWRDQFTDRQTPSGPFDSGFFFDSGIAPRGGDSPYLH